MKKIPSTHSVETLLLHLPTRFSSRLAFASSLGAVLLLAMCVTRAMAQMSTAELTGSVHDSQALAMPGVHVEAVNQKTGQHFPAETNSLGEFLIRALPLGDYAVQAQAPGFKPYRSETMSLTAAQVARLNVNLRSAPRPIRSL